MAMHPLREPFRHTAAAVTLNLRTRLSITNFCTIKAPIVRATVRVLRGTDEYITLRPVTAMDSLPRGLRPMGTSGVSEGTQTIGKRMDFQINTDEGVFLEVGVSKSGAGHSPLSRMMYFRVSTGLPLATLTIRTGLGPVDVLSGPLEQMTGPEARAAFKHLHKPSLAADLARDGRRLGMTFTSERPTSTVRTVETIDEEGMPTTVAVRRRRRILE